MRPLATAALMGMLTIGTPALAHAQAAAQDSVYVDVKNERAVPVSVYLKTGRFDRRVAIVNAGQSTTVRLPAWALDGRTGFALLVHAEGESDIGMHAYTVRSGDRLSLTVPAKGSIPSSPDDAMMAPLSAEDLAETTITVENPRDRPVTVFAETPQYAVRLGTVAAKESGTLNIPKSAVGPDKSVKIFVHPEGGADLATATMRIKSGEHLGLKVPKY